jgi:hypothetical protein
MVSPPVDSVSIILDPTSFDCKDLSFFAVILLDRWERMEVCGRSNTLNILDVTVCGKKIRIGK